MRVTHVLPRSTAVLTLLAAALALTGCAGQEEGRSVSADPTTAGTSGGAISDGGTSGGGSAGGPGSASSTEPDSMITSTNSHMMRESWHASGDTTAFSGARQEMWSDPADGFHMRVTGSQPGDVYCDKGTSYTSAPLFAAALNERGQSIKVPDYLKDRYVSTVLNSGCEIYYLIPEFVQRAKDKDRTVGGQDAEAYEGGNGQTQDVYYIGGLNILRLDSTRDGRTSTTTYDSFGKSFSITMPPASKVMTVSEFRTAVNG
ncbi:hypothetical protein ABZ990_11545 [Streptomyces sp. NPDC046203]|uniref:hypothetical protein n=1 Tax=Streptomyces sp. NPDC046203 TaxID=3154602 RepID=UPI0033F8FA31